MPTMWGCKEKLDTAADLEVVADQFHFGDNPNQLVVTGAV